MATQNKPCSRCKADLALSLYSKNVANKDGLSYVCKSCTALKRKEVSELHPERAELNKQRLKQWRIENPDKSRESVRVWRGNNRAYAVTYNKNRYATKKEQITQQVKAYRELNIDKLRESGRKHYHEHREKYLENSKLWARKNKGICNAKSREREIAKMKRTPKWLSKDDRWVIKEIYTLSALRTELFGFAWHVDHIIPLRGTSVSGLHVPSNLRVVPASVNISKRNTYKD
jgi:hypothetical protein